MTRKHKIDFDQNYYPNIDDFTEHFWKNDYHILLTSQGISFFVNADNEQEALDFIIDYCEDKMPGLVASINEIDESEADQYYCGGNHSLYLTTDHIHIKKLRG